jgi:putative Ca2+/H+ antiporter (TMEM165/GDT1 family)
VSTCLAELSAQAVARAANEAWRDLWFECALPEPDRAIRPWVRRPAPEWSQMAQLLPIFITVFLAELGDKTQLATLLFAAERQQNPLWVFAAAAMALIASCAIAVAVGSAAQQHLTALPLKLVAGIGFMLLGAWTIVCHFR